MKTMLVACQTIEGEICRALASLGLDYPVLWLDGGLHDSPDRLRRRVQAILDEASGRCQRLIIALGYCGGGLCSLKTGDYQTVLPMADDCLSLLLGSMEARRVASRPATYFLTEGWMRHESNVVSADAQIVAKYGQAKADRLNRLMLRHYRRFGLIETGCYDMGAAIRKISPLARRIGIRVENIPGAKGWLEDLLTGPYHDPRRFMLLPPGSALDYQKWADLFLCSPPDTSAPGQLFPATLPKGSIPQRPDDRSSQPGEEPMPGPSAQLSPKSGQS